MAYRGNTGNGSKAALVHHGQLAPMGGDGSGQRQFYHIFCHRLGEATCPAEPWLIEATLEMARKRLLFITGSWRQWVVMGQASDNFIISFVTASERRHARLSHGLSRQHWKWLESGSCSSRAAGANGW
ncbi:hypothetical protein Tcan_06316 [Toxocara canis]|uniref:Uncharacterized protein n=1 Tax=Toxocara canis TaxID=6265 RepID=A0A0B2VI55_TOXCA|nr:hypothetical protein Tcan_06316 [Toxocara canis]